MDGMYSSNELSRQLAMRQMIQDLSVVAKIPSDDIQRLSKVLEMEDGFLTEEKLLNVIEAYFKDEAVVEAVFNVLMNLRVESLEDVLDTVETWRKFDKRNLEQFPDSLYDALAARLPQLVREYAALARNRKAEGLRTILGNELKGWVFICDARPVYNESRDAIEGLIPLTTLKLVFERQNLEMEEVEMTLSFDQLHDFILEAQKAERKLSTLRESIASWIPNGCVDEE